MSGYTNAVTNITDESQYYVYPMAASLRGGAVESEYNIRNLMTCLFNKSSAKRDEDFILFYNRVIDGQRPTLETYYENSNWYRIDFDNKYCEVYDLAVGPGEGNCNGYYTRLYDYTPMNNTALDISALMETNAGYTPVLPSDLMPSGVVATTTYDSLSDLKSAENTKSVNEGSDATYVVDGVYIDNTSVRVKLTGSDTYIYYIKLNGNWTLSSDIVTVYETDENGQRLAQYRIYSDGKYSYQDPKSTNKDITTLSFKDCDVYKDDMGTLSTTDDLSYVILDGDCTLYKRAAAYQNFNVVLGLNWTTNQLVSSVQLNVCEDTTPIRFITETDLDGDTTQYSYTEYEFLNKSLKDQGLLDSGILLGTIKVKKTPVYNADKEYTYEYSCTYEGNRYKTACIDLDKLGTDTDNLGENMYDKIKRLFTLMIDNGSFKIGSVIRNSGFDSNPDSVNHNFVKGIAPYRMDLGISDFEAGVGQEYITGYLRFINYNEETNSAKGLDDGYIFKCRLKVSPDTGEGVTVDTITFFNDAIECYTEAGYNHINLHANIDIDHNLTVAETLTSRGNLFAHSDIQLGGKLEFGVNGPTLTVDTDGAIKTAKFTTTGLLKANSLSVPNTLTVNNTTFTVDTEKLDIKSADGTIHTKGLIKTDANVNANEVHATKVYGAVWM